MNAEIIRALDAEIEKLQQVRQLLSDCEVLGEESPRKVSSGERRGRAVPSTSPKLGYGQPTSEASRAQSSAAEKKR